MAKFMSFFTIALLLSFVTFISAARPNQADFLVPHQNNGEIKGENKEKVICEEGIGEEECLSRRTLEAAYHLDYIYTQEKSN
ncbi:hypothetical protein F8388_023849 [Cannabis sativa]|uniref:Phytosulfokine n=1 Tax=Cannabis sativa TaxID=3483 RepID=A0A7J6GAH9_CANSA|nr:hypothetical protein F8388_023849 [Cannabis sativa]